jgi:hypothetical protein
MEKASLTKKFALINEHWRPKVVASLNGQEVKLVKFAGVFPWHHHEREDEMFMVWRGEMEIEFRDGNWSCRRANFASCRAVSNIARWLSARPRF